MYLKTSYLCINYICIITFITKQKRFRRKVEFNHNDPIKGFNIVNFHQIRGVFD